MYEVSFNNCAVDKVSLIITNIRQRAGTPIPSTGQFCCTNAVLHVEPMFYAQPISKPTIFLTSQDKNGPTPMASALRFENSKH